MCNWLFGATMGSPVYPLAANIFMERLEESAIAMAPMNIKPKLWRRQGIEPMDIALD